MRASKAAGTVTVTIDARNPKSDEPGFHESTGRFNKLGDLVPLLVLLTELFGPGCEVFFDFGVVSITNVNLEAIGDRFDPLRRR